MAFKWDWGCLGDGRGARILCTAPLAETREPDTPGCCTVASGCAGIAAPEGASNAAGKIRQRRMEPLTVVHVLRDGADPRAGIGNVAIGPSVYLLASSIAGPAPPRPGLPCAGGRARRPASPPTAYAIATHTASCAAPRVPWRTPRCCRYPPSAAAPTA